MYNSEGNRNLLQLESNRKNIYLKGGLVEHLNYVFKTF